MKPQHPGEFLQDLMSEYRLTAKDVAEKTGISTPIISRIINGKAPLSVYNALRIGKLFGLDRTFLNNLQLNFDMYEIANTKNLKDQLDAIEPLDLKLEFNTDKDVVINVAGGTTVDVGKKIDVDSLRVTNYRRANLYHTKRGIELPHLQPEWDEAKAYGKIKLPCGMAHIHYDKEKNRIRIVGVGSMEIRFDFAPEPKQRDRYHIFKSRETIMPEGFDLDSLIVTNYKTGVFIDTEWKVPIPNGKPEWMVIGDIKGVKTATLSTGRGENINFKYLVEKRLLIVSGPQETIIEFDKCDNRPRNRYQDLVMNNETWLMPIHGAPNLLTLEVISGTNKHGSIEPIRTVPLFRLVDPLIELWAGTVSIGEQVIAISYDRKQNRLTMDGSSSVCIRFEYE